MGTPSTRLVVCLVAAALLAGCGGGGGGGTPGIPMPPGVTMNAAELALATDALAAINVHRANNALAPLLWYQLGADVGYAHCLRMEADGFFAHVDPVQMTDPATRALNAGITNDVGGSIDPYSGNPFVGENLAGATGAPSVTFTGQQAVNVWIGSPGHNAQLVAPLLAPGAPQAMPAWTHCGIGVRITTTEIWYTAMFFRNPTP